MLLPWLAFPALGMLLPAGTDAGVRAALLLASMAPALLLWAYLYILALDFFAPLSGPSSREAASRSVRRALLTPQNSPGSLYRSGTRI